jgi:hypothetical protein
VAIQPLELTGSMEILPNTQTREAQCSSCPFLKRGLELQPEVIAEIHQYLLRGQNHYCHSDPTNHTICRGGRNYQLETWCRMGVIAAPTDEALRLAMEAAGVKPRSHI